jgi:SAM-dependent methyltransferase
MNRTMITEDLPALAQQSFALAQRFCSDCRAYHATWGYLRVAGLRKGATSDTQLLTDGLKDPIRVLIAGSADAGQLAAVAASLEGRRFSVTLVDVCETPLELCKAFAESQGIALKAVRRDIARSHELGPFDAVLFHNFLGFLDADHRLETLRSLNAALNPDGRLIIFQRVAPTAAEPSPGIDGEAVAQLVVSGLMARGLTLPEDEGAFRNRIAAATYNDGRNRRLAAFSSIAQLENELRQAGYTNIVVVDADQYGSGPNPFRRTSPRYMMLARP